LSVFATLVESLAVPDGGFSFDVFKWQAVTNGYAVSIYPECECRLSWPITARDLADYVDMYEPELSTPRSVFGGWRDPDSGDVFLDVSTVVDTQEEARSLAERYGQLAYFDFAAGRSVNTSAVPA
jgi:hypothetical protein